MNRILCLFLLAFSGVSIASPGITVQVITPGNAHELGFSITIEVNSEATSVNFAGPVSINGNCFAGRSGNALMDEEGNELTVYTTQIRYSQVDPVAFGYYTSNKTTMSVWLDYFCPPGEENKSRRFIVPSVAKYLIASLGAGQ